MKRLRNSFDDNDVEYGDEKYKEVVVAEKSVKKGGQYWIKLMAAGLFRLSIVMTIFFFQYYYSRRGVGVDELIFQEPDDVKEPMEVFELALPILHKNPVLNEVLLNHSFANSWGKPAIKTFVPPKDVEFNRVVLQLNISVEGVQYDRLAHIFIDDIPVWRTSTPEPGNQEVYSSVSKDISKYLPLFEREELELVFELDNLITGKLTGVFNTTLSITYYNEDLKDDEDDAIASLFKITNRPSNKITQLVEHQPNRTPLIYYPDKPLVFNIPEISQNTTNLKLALYVSGNSAEEFWYTNVLDEFKDKFTSHGHGLFGHGPVRVINVYINDVLVNTLAPEPVIYSGGISPALWRPIIGINAFDIKPLEIDITAFLPKLWGNKGAQLRIEITNGQDVEPLKIGENWIASANLLHWESPKIESSFGEIISYDNSSFFGGYGVSNDVDNLYQSVFANRTVGLLSNITVNLFNGTQLPLKVHTYSHAVFSNFQQYAGYADTQFVSSLISSTFESMVYLATEGDEEDVSLNKLSSTKAHPQVISLATHPMDSSRNVNFNVNITTVYGSNVRLNGKEVFSLESYHNGTSYYVLGPTGNSGFGSAYQNFVADLKSPFPKLKIDELVEAVNGTVVRRESGTNSAGIVDIASVDSGKVVSAHREHLLQLRENDAVSEEFVTHFMESLIQHDGHFQYHKNSRNVEVGVDELKDNVESFNIGGRVLLE